MEIVQPNIAHIEAKQLKNQLTKIEETYERDYSLSNLEVVHWLVEHTEPLEFVISNEELTDEELNQCIVLALEKQDINQLDHIRTFFITLAQDRTLPLWKRLLLIKKYAKLIEKKIANNTYYDNFIKVLYKNIEDKRVNWELENLPTTVNAKYVTLNILINLKHQMLESNFETILNPIFETNESLKEMIESNSAELEKLDRKWQNFIKDKDYIFEHYTVLYLFSHFISSALQKNINTEINFMILYIVLIKYTMQILWYMNKGKLSQEEIENIVKDFTMLFDQDENFKLAVEQSGLLEDLNDLGCCSILIR